MKPGKLDLPTIWRGADWPPVTLVWKDQNGDPFNLTGWTPTAKSINLNLNPTVTHATTGITQIVRSKVENTGIKLGIEAWDWVWVRDSDGYEFPPFLAGNVTIKEPVSKPDVIP